ncbi:hypothetical protein [Phenylobacterium sp.]|uniref:hypothetical protein n=1 Tax=Phenylobacterium sp. TaxID=1871053 RepID=UPI0011FCD35D|nr:hypothetical protein [Phenylobacterium sp.]THD61053.1 MAG: hypothetical protein E8A49_12365 [Phenylobacterium sp.]
MTRAAALALIFLSGLALSACDKAGSSAAGQGGGKFAGLDGEILNWRQEILASDPLCKATAADQKCQNFEVACKAERALTADDQAKGVSARVVSAITFNGWDPKLKQQQAGSRTAEFDKAGAGWTRKDHPPVNMSSCADL